MDTGTLIVCILVGLLLSFFLIFSGYEVAYFLSIPALLIVFGGTAAAVFIAFPLKSIRKSMTATLKCFAKPQNDSQNIIRQIIFFSASAKRTGLLALEGRLNEVRDPFFAEGLRLVVDGLPPSTVESILNNEIDAMQHRHQQVRNIVLHCGKCAPAFGMVGTLIGLVMMLTNLDPATIGPGMAIAVLTTLYGLLATNLIFLPIAEKLRQLHDAEMQIKAMIVRGVLAIQAGEHPRIIRMKLQTFLPWEERQDSDSEMLALMEDIQTATLAMEKDETENDKMEKVETKRAA